MPLGQKVVAGHVVSDFFKKKFAYEFKIYSYFVVCREDKKWSRAQLYKILPVCTVYEIGLNPPWQALVKLWGEGGLRRLYRGIGPALLQGPLSRL